MLQAQAVPLWCLVVRLGDGGLRAQPGRLVVPADDVRPRAEMLNHQRGAIRALKPTECTDQQYGPTVLGIWTNSTRRPEGEDIVQGCVVLKKTTTPVIPIYDLTYGERENVVMFILLSPLFVAISNVRLDRGIG